MDERTKRTAEMFDILKETEALEKDLLQIPEVVKIDFDLNGFLSGIYQVIFVAKYNIPVHLENYFDTRKRMLYDVLDVAEKYDLYKTEDRIEDYGEHFYFVFGCKRAWRKGTFSAVKNGNPTCKKTFNSESEAIMFARKHGWDAVENDLSGIETWKNLVG